MLQHEGLSPYPVPRDSTPSEPGAASRALARVRWFSLDGRLAAGEDPAGSKLLAARVDSREALYARGLARLERLLSDSTGPAFQGSAGQLSAELERVEDELSGIAREGAPQSGARGSSPRRLSRLRTRDSAVPPRAAGSSFA